MSKPVLYIFAISHYCEKTRWALDYLSIDYRLKHLMPGPHAKAVKSLGTARSSLPVLAHEKRCVQGSANIIDWAEQRIGKPVLTPPMAEADCRSIEQRVDEVLGVHVRRQFYSEALPEFPETVRPIFMKNLGFAEKFMLRVAWGQVCSKMIQLMDLGPEQREESRALVAQELDWLDSLVTPDSLFLAGDQLSRADLAVASLLAPIAMPAEHPTYSQLELPPKFSEDMEQWSDRPIVAWTRRTYRQFRHACVNQHT